VLQLRGKLFWRFTGKWHPYALFMI
jgi:muconolactone delta-isomerase